MKLFSKPKTAADFGITYTGNDLERFNHRFIKRPLDAYNMPTPKIIVIYIMGIASLVANICIAYTNAPNLFTMVAMIAPSLVLACVVIYSFFIKDNTFRRRIRRFVAGSCLLFFIPTGIAVLVGDILFNYWLFVASLVIGLIVGIHNWGKKTMKDLLISDEAAKADSKLTRGITMLIAVALVPVIRSLSEQKEALISILIFITVILCALLGWSMGIGITNIRYYKFLKKQK